VGESSTSQKKAARTTDLRRNKSPFGVRKEKQTTYMTLFSGYILFSLILISFFFLFTPKQEREETGTSEQTRS
jgi:hypothetical protein